MSKTSSNDDLDRAIAQVATSRQKEIDEHVREQRKQQFLKATKYIVDDINGHDQEKTYYESDYRYKLRKEYFLADSDKLRIPKP